MSQKIKVLQHGVGAKGKTMVEFMLRKKEIDLVGAIDLVNVGSDLGDVIGLNRRLGIVISDNLGAVLTETKPDVMLDATLTHTRGLYPIFMKAIEAGVNIISIGAQAFNPWVNEPELAKKLDEAAKKKRVSIIGTGMGTGFRFDVLPLYFTGICGSVSKITCNRVSDAAKTGHTFRQRAGFGLSKDEAEKKLASGEVEMNLAYPDQVKFISDCLGWGVLNLKEVKEFFISTTIRDHLPDYVIQPGQVCGYRHDCYGMKEDGKVLLELKTITIIDPSLEGLEPRFTVSIQGDPGVTVDVPALSLGKNVPRYVAAHAVNWIPHIIKARPGLLTNLRDYPVVSCLPSVEWNSSE